MEESVTKDEKQDLYEALEDEFQRWMNRLPCYITDDVEEGVEECFKKFTMTARTITQVHVLKSKGLLRE